MADKFYADDIVVLKEDPSISATVEQTWRESEPSSLRRPDDWIFYIDITSASLRSCARDGHPPKGWVIIRFLDPYAGCTLITEDSLILKGRDLAVGDIVKRKAIDAQSGVVIKSSFKCLIRPVYNGLPFHGTEPWPHKPEDNELRVPSEELTCVDYMIGDYVLWKDHVGEVRDIYEEVTVRLSNGSVVRVKSSDDLGVDEFPTRASDDMYERLVPFLKYARERLQDAALKGEKRRPAFFYPGQVVYTTKANLRLGNWVIGSYSPSQAPRGIVVEVRVVSMTINWLSYNAFNIGPIGWNTPASIISRTRKPPEFITTDDMDELRLYNKYTHAPYSSGVTSDFGDRTSHAHAVGDYIKFRDITAAEAKYSGSSNGTAGPDHLTGSEGSGIFRRIPRNMTDGFDMNFFSIREIEETVDIQWQDGTVTKHLSTELIPCLNADDDDLWIGEICSLKEAEVKSGNGSLRLGQVGVVQSVDASERTAVIRWFQAPDITLFAPNLSIMESPGRLGPISDNFSTVSIYDVIAHNDLSKRRGELVIIAPNDGPRNIPRQFLPHRGIHFSGARRQGTAADHDNEYRWFGEIVDVGKDGLLTVRLGALTRVEDIRVPVTQVYVVVGDDTPSDGISDDADYSDDDSSDEMDLSEPEAIEEVITYEGGQRLDDGNEDTWTTEEDDEDDRPVGGGYQRLQDGGTPCDGDQRLQNETIGNAQREEVEQEGANHMDGIEETEDAAEKPGRAICDSGTIVTNKNESSPLTSVIPQAEGSKRLDRHPEYDFSAFSSMPSTFEILDERPPSDHRYVARSMEAISPGTMRRIRKEHMILAGSLPPGIWVRTWAERLDLIRILILGPRNTPYELAPFVFDIHCGADFPAFPPRVFFHSWTGSAGRVNPNLYEDGKVCLSILGTWPENDKAEGWNREKSSVLQIIVSIMGLVLVEKPYYNEAGFEPLVGTDETYFASRMYSEKAFCMAKGFVTYAINNPISPMEKIVKWLYTEPTGPLLLKTVVQESRQALAEGRGWEESETRNEDAMEEDNGNVNGKGKGKQKAKISAGAGILLTRHLRALEELLRKLEEAPSGAGNANSTARTATLEEDGYEMMS